MSTLKITIRIPDINADLAARFPYYREGELRVKEGFTDVLERAPGPHREIFYVSAASQSNEVEELVRAKFGNGFYGVWSFTEEKIIAIDKDEKPLYALLKA